MRKLIVSIIAATLAGCSTFDKDSDTTTVFDYTIDKLPLIYRPEIQQGNVIRQEMVDKLAPGMSKRQVKFIMGTPMLIDVFHQERWDYVFTKSTGSSKEEQQQVALFFADDKLARIEGDFRPLPKEEQVVLEKEVVVSVPDWESPDSGFWSRTLDKISVHKKKEDN